MHSYAVLSHDSCIYCIEDIAVTKRTIEKKNIFEDTYKEYDTKSIQQVWGERINEFNRNWNNMTKEEQHEVLEEYSDIFERFVE